MKSGKGEGDGYVHQVKQVLWNLGTTPRDAYL